jgi:hypothetical protein
MPLPVDIDVGDATATPASRITPQAGGHLKVVQPSQAGRPAQRAAEDAWLAPHRLQEVAQPTKPMRALRRNELSFGAWLLGLTSMVCLIAGGTVALVGGVIPHDGLVRFGTWTAGIGAALLLALIVRSDR